MIDRSEADMILAPFSHGQAGCRQIGATFFNQLQHITQVVGHDDFQVDTQSFGKTLRQLILKAGNGIAFDVVTGQTVATQHAELTALLNLIQMGLCFAAGGQHGQSQQEYDHRFQA